MVKSLRRSIRSKEGAPPAAVAVSVALCSAGLSFLIHRLSLGRVDVSGWHDGPGSQWEGLSALVFLFVTPLAFVALLHNRTSGLRWVLAFIAAPLVSIVFAVESLPEQRVQLDAVAGFDRWASSPVSGIDGLLTSRDVLGQGPNFGIVCGKRPASDIRTCAVISSPDGAWIARFDYNALRGGPELFWGETKPFNCAGRWRDFFDYCDGPS